MVIMADILYLGTLKCVFSVIVEKVSLRDTYEKCMYGTITTLVENRKIMGMYH